MFTRHLINHSGAELLAGETVAVHFKIISHITMFHAADGFPVKPQTPFPASNQVNKSEHNETCELDCTVFGSPE